MKRHLLVVIPVSLLILTAGCTGVLGPSEETPATPNESQATEFDDYPSGFSEDGITDVKAAVAAHKSATLATGSWSVTYTTDLESGEQSQSAAQTQSVNHEGSTVMQTAESGYGTQHTYQTNSESWSIQTASNQSSYTYAAEGYNSSASVHAPMLTEFLGNVNYEQTDVTEQDGTAYATYTATGLTNDSIFTQTNSSHLENISSSFTVAEDGRVTNFDFETTVVAEHSLNSTVDISLAFSDYGATTVEEPDWLTEAQNRTSGSASPAPEPAETQTADE